MNRLVHEHSPYLRDHAEQPVDWYPWGDEAFERAHTEDRPVFLSIGYSTCHWCHVMAHESFEDSQVATLLNDSFICVKVDREEYPAIDSYFMTAAHLMTGSGGWPLTMVMTPDKVPFFAATYVPRETSMGTIGMFDLVPRIAEIWRDRRSEIEEAAGRIAASIAGMSVHVPGERMEPEILERTYQELSNRYDPENGGFDQAPKFPSPHNLLFLLRFWKRTGTYFALEMAECTLDAMRRGGIHDQVGGGFHRYSTDRHWQLPHFEKMLTDQAMLALAYTEAYHATGNESFAVTARDILTYVERDLGAPEGGFYTAEDADSEGGEGAFYTWRADEIDEVLSPEQADLARICYGITAEGNVIEEATRRKTGANILTITRPLDELAAELAVPVAELAGQLDDITRTLFDVRSQRARPRRDEKIMTDWNGLMIAGFAYAGRVFDSDCYREIAGTAAQWLINTMYDPDQGLLHRHHHGEVGIPGYLDDYAFLIWGLLELYDATFDMLYLDTSLELSAIMREKFWDTEHGGFFSTPTDDTTLPVRRKETFDGAIPAGNSVAVMDLVRIARITGDNTLERLATQAGQALAEPVTRSLSGHCMFMNAMELLMGDSVEVVIAGDLAADDTKRLIATLNRRYLPGSAVLHRPTGETGNIDRIAPFSGTYQPVDGAAAGYVCRNHICSQPVTDPDALDRLLTTGANQR